MVTYFLGQEEVRAYMRDLMARLQHVEEVPTYWCPLTRSGNELLNALKDVVVEKYPDLAESIVIIPVEVEDGTSRVVFPGETTPPDLTNKHVLIFDGAVHTGRMMSLAVAEVLKRGAAGVCTYTLMLKRGSAFIPTLWGVTIGDDDRAYFLLSNIPNNRLDAGSLHSNSKKKALSIHLRLLSEEDAKRPLVMSGVRSLDRVTWGDRYFSMKSGGDRRCTYVLEMARGIVGYLTLSVHSDDCLMVDEVVVDKAHHGKNLGGVLLRFADTMARQSNCRLIRLQSIADKRDLYLKFGYRTIANSPLKLDEEEYWLMEKSVIHPAVFLG